MNDLLLITPPDIIYNQNLSYLLIYPGNEVRTQFHNIISKTNNRKNVYLYNQPEDEPEIDWLLSIANMSELVLADIDNSSAHVRMLMSYIVSLPQTYWFANNDQWCYTKLNPNRLYGLDKIEHLLGEKIEKE